MPKPPSDFQNREPSQKDTNTELAATGRTSCDPVEQQPQSELEKAAHARMLKLIDHGSQRITGTRTKIAASKPISQMTEALTWAGKCEFSSYEQAIAVLGEMDAKSYVQSMLAVQLTAVHEAAIRFLGNSQSDCATYEHSKIDIQLATKLLHAFRESAELLQKLKGETGHQKVTVEHVHVHEGGQAIVGVVSPQNAKGGGGQK